MTLINFHYQTELIFSSPASDHHFTLKIMPQNDGRQNIKKISWRVDPSGVMWHSNDSFGNRTLSGHIDPPHDYFVFGIHGTAEVSKDPFIEAGETDHVLLYHSELTHAFKPLVDFYKNLEPSAPKEPLERLFYFTNAVCNHMQYQRGITTSKTTAQEAFDGGIGVCQDYTHILLSILRLDGVLCRYVAGLASDYGETHAWVEALIGDKYYGIDPTRNKLIDENYLAISRGRDFNDCSIERGIFRGADRGRQIIELHMEVPQ